MSRRLLACPIAVVEAPPESVWRLLEEPAALESWVDAEVVAAEPPGPMQAGQRIALRTREYGLTFKAEFLIKEVDPHHRWLDLDVRLPIGVVNHERITLQPVERGTLVSFN